MEKELLDPAFVCSIKSLINESKRKTYSAINIIMLETYWNIGRMIVEEEQNGKNRAGYGDALIANLSKELTKTFGKGFSRSNLQSMRTLYLRYEKSQTLSGKLSWSHYLELITIKDDNERSFYEKECENSNWSVRELKRQKESCLYHRLLLAKDVVSREDILRLSREGITYIGPDDFIKDPLVLDFVSINEEKPKLESDLEKAILEHLKDFLLELGRGFMFVGSQQRISLGGENYYVDLVFYNKILKCYVLIDLKMNKLRAENFGQMNLYVNYYKNEINEEGDNDPVGIVLCTEKDKVVAKYALEGLVNNIYASTYTYIIPSKEILENEIKKLLD